MNKFIFSIAAILGLYTTPAIAQSYDPFPTDTAGCSYIVNYICHSRLDDGSPSIAAIPSGYDGRYVLVAQKAGPRNTLISLFDRQSNQIAAYIFLDSNDRPVDYFGGTPGLGGNIDRLQELTDEMVDLILELRLYSR